MEPREQPTPLEILHNAARHYCLQRINMWHHTYAELTELGRDRVERSDGSGDDTPEALNVFPRYNVLEAILSGVESWVPDAHTSVEDGRTLLRSIATIADNALAHAANPIEHAAIEEEHRLYEEFVCSCDLGKCATLPRLPFRRVLSEAEHERIRDAFERHWGVWYGGEVDRSVPHPHVTLHSAAMDEPGAPEILRKALAQLGVSRMMQLSESRRGHEIDLEAADFVYDGDEHWWTSRGLAWMVYVSHELSITFGGHQLIDAMRASLPGFNKYLYRGWDLKLYS